LRAIVQDGYGQADALQVRDVPVPTPAAGDVLVRVHAAGVNAADWHLMTGEPYVSRLAIGLRRPRNPIVGSDFSGVVEATGADVTRFRIGDEVMGEADRGCLADYVCISDKYVVGKPSPLTHQQAAALPMGALTALQALRDAGELQSGQSVLVNGASSGVGIYAVQIAIAMGAIVTGVCSGRNIDMVKSLGTNVVVDYTQEDFVDTAERYDLVVDIVASRSLADIRRVLRPKGRYVIVGAASMGKWFGLGRQVRTIATSPFVSQTLRPMLARRTQEDLEHVRQMAEAGQLVPVIDRDYPFEDSAAAIRHVQDGHARGKVVVTVA